MDQESRNTHIDRLSQALPKLTRPPAHGGGWDAEPEPGVGSAEHRVRSCQAGTEKIVTVHVVAGRPKGARLRTTRLSDGAWSRSWCDTWRRRSSAHHLLLGLSVPFCDEFHHIAAEGRGSNSKFSPTGKELTELVED